mmetsp:Transcript_20615/g.62900  ORF Transcript_20615/g.62900 Transcript_20615/m.62900 type:complete len:84 (-) Transcript_20615:77-328(-)|eukprot:scaffold213457_cov35-Tisochrysis_lutea.AAC.3
MDLPNGILVSHHKAVHLLKAAPLVLEHKQAIAADSATGADELRLRSAHSLLAWMRMHTFVFLLSACGVCTVALCDTRMNTADV